MNDTLRTLLKSKGRTVHTVSPEATVLDAVRKMNHADVRISHLGYDRLHTTAEDAATWFPLAQLQQAVKAGRLGGLTPRFHGAPTNRSQRVTMETDAPELLRRCREDGADVVLLVPN